MTISFKTTIVRPLNINKKVKINFIGYLKDYKLVLISMLIL